MKIKRHSKNSICLEKSPFCLRIKELHMPNEPEVNIRAEDIVFSLRANYYKKKRKRKKSTRDGFRKFDEQNIMIKRKDHICDWREKVNHKFQLYNRKADQFFLESNSRILDEMSVIAKKHLQESLTTAHQIVTYSTPRASNVRFSSFNRMVVSDFKMKNKDKQESSRVIKLNLDKDSTQQSNRESNLTSGQLASDISREPIRHTVIFNKNQYYDMTKAREDGSIHFSASSRASSARARDRKRERGPPALF